MIKPLSVVVITFQEERKIARCISSVQGLADEVLVLDSYSTDKTKQIAESLGARFVQHAFDGHIQQKNRAAKMATYDYVLSLDADEALSDELKQSILIEKNQGFPKDGYLFNRRTQYNQKWIKYGGWYPDAKFRLWNKGKGLWGGINPHDKWDFSLANASWSKLSGDILHYSFKGAKDYEKQSFYFADIAAKALYEKGHKKNILAPFIHAIAKFLKMYIWHLGVLDGKEGLEIARITARATFYKYQTLNKLNKKGA